MLTAGAAEGCPCPEPCHRRATRGAPTAGRTEQLRRAPRQAASHLLPAGTPVPPRALSTAHCSHRVKASTGKKRAEPVHLPLPARRCPKRGPAADACSDCNASRRDSRTRTDRPAFRPTAAPQAQGQPSPALTRPVPPLPHSPRCRRKERRKRRARSPGGPAAPPELSRRPRRAGGGRRAAPSARQRLPCPRPPRAR